MSDWWDRVGWFKGHTISSARPVYHRQLPWDERSEDGDEIRFSTACGITTHHWNRETGEKYSDGGTLLRRDYADRFARACKKCWPEDVA